MRKSIALFLCGATLIGCSASTLPELLVISGARVYGPDGSKIVTIAIGDSVQLRPFARLASGDSASVFPWDRNWQSRNPAVAVAADQSGKLLGKASGTATIVLTLAAQFTDSLTIVVR